MRVPICPGIGGDMGGGGGTWKGREPFACGFWYMVGGCSCCAVGRRRVWAFSVPPAGREELDLVTSRRRLYEVVGV